MTRRKLNRSGSAKSIVLGVVAIVAITGAGLYILTTLNDERARLRPPQDAATAEAKEQTPEPAPEGTDPFEVRTKVVIDSKGGPGGRPIVLLSAPFCAASGGAIGQERQGLIARELVRQAFLIAARDELGATTRDVVTGELVKVEAEPAAVISSVFPRGKPARAFVRKSPGTAKDVLIEGDLGLVASKELETPDDLALLVERAEALSRAEFPNVLKKLGLPAGAAVSWGDAPAPEGVDARIDSLAFTEAFAAVRLLHAAIKKDGESPARLAALARAYALLGVLTEFQLRPAHKAYKARALLYAQRLVGRRPADPAAYWNRAFVWTLVGRPKEALADLDLVSNRAKTEPKAQPPVWVSVIDAAARHDVDRLGQAPAGAADLASFLRMSLLEFPASPMLTTAAARDVLARAPECYRAIGDEADLETLSNRAYFRWAAGDYKSASAGFEQLYTSQKTADDLFRAVMTADAAGDLERRDALYKQFRDAYGKVAPKTVLIWDRMLGGIDKIKAGTFDWKPIDEIVQSISADRRWYTEFVVGQFIRNHGKPSDALKYHTSCSRAAGVWGWIKAIANDSARAGLSDLKSAFECRIHGLAPRSDWGGWRGQFPSRVTPRMRASTASA